MNNYNFVSVWPTIIDYFNTDEIFLELHNLATGTHTHTNLNNGTWEEAGHADDELKVEGLRRFSNHLL